MNAKTMLIIIALLTPISAIGNGDRVIKTYGMSRNGELKYSENFKHFDYVNPDAPKGGSMKRVSIGTFNSLNPHLLKGIAPAGITMIYDSLLVKSDDELASYYGLLAETIEYPEDNRWVQFNIRPEAKWHNGTPVTADDVVFSFNTILDKGNPIYRSYYKNVEKIEKISTKSVRFYLKKPYTQEVKIMCGLLPIISKDYYTENDFNETNMNFPLGNSAYKIKSVAQGKFITYERVKNYWGKDLAVNQGKNNFDTIKYDYYRDSAVAIEAFKSEDYDFRYENIAKFWNTAYDGMTEIADGQVIKEEISHKKPTGLQAFVFNLRKDKFKDKRIRKAINYLFNFEWTNKNIFHSSYKRAKSYFPNSEYASSGIPKGKELEILNEFASELPAELFAKEFSLPQSEKGRRKQNRKNIRIASRLFTQAGWVAKNGKIIDPKTQKQAEINFLITSKAFSRVLLPMKHSLNMLGIKCKIIMLDNAEYLNRVNNFDFDIVVKYFFRNVVPGTEQVSYWHSKEADVKGSHNIIGIKNPVIDYLTEQIVQNQGKKDLIYIVRALDRVLLWEYYLIPNWYTNLFRIIYWNKFGRPYKQPPYALGLDNWWDKNASEQY